MKQEHKQLLMDAADDCESVAADYLRESRNMGLTKERHYQRLADECIERANKIRALVENPEPVPMLLFCPRCDTQHIDAPQPDRGWDNPPHRSHECRRCGHIWRPSDVPTVGVAELTTKGQKDSRPAPFDGCRMLINELGIEGRPPLCEAELACSGVLPAFLRRQAE